ncbi:MAG: methionine synthase, partial [Candidatus Omnitrophica bacterium]|nr:methionine synthase [Candidatus Omnitrophota bacterium]
MNNLNGLATGIGSLPYKDVNQAIDAVFRYTPNIPFWPQLPKRDVREGMLAQFTENLPLLKVSQDGVKFLPHEVEDGALEKFYERIIANDAEYFKISEDYAQGFYAFCRRLEKSDLKDIAYIKCHVTGPFTFAASLKDANGVSLLHDAVFFQVILKGLAMKALWQIERLRKFGKKMILFFDEPFLAGFGSAYTPINREDVVTGLIDFTQGLKFPDLLIGVHCCGNTDWSIFT